ncbi:UDP-N-acetylglucosamine 2-epimerase [Desulfovulcanus ferrireducens]|uniref:UDP-N-acetylglucosamine 2-epimerase n=1 Tax=Desulfovulcanus ferrireducens TaxID=2831190 RepID=UPI0025A499DE|nr:UDP-N-acetylglucosamine 2-epimerase [Desulfovulcanus ferrireducens]
MKRKICIFTGTRAEYGLLKPLMEEIQKDRELCLQIVVSGMHLSPEFGLTYKEIESEGFKIDEKIEILLSSDSAIGISKSIGLGIISYSEALERLKPDIVVILGDRFEALAFAIASFVARLPIAHLYGGETTEGAFDEAFRHSITKMSYLHFTSTEEYKKRVIQLGECPERVFNVGALGIDNIKKMNLLSKDELEKKINFKFNKHNILVTFHPATLEKETSREQIINLLDVLDELEDTNIIFTKANADIDGRIINKMIDEYVQKNKQKSIVFTSMGQLLYLSTMQYIDAIVGNSSSGIIEAPSFKIGTINIGDRQKGRIKAKSVIDCQPNKKDIREAFQKLYSKKFRKQLKNTINPYGDGESAEKIVTILKKYKVKNTKKNFYNIKLDTLLA